MPQIFLIILVAGFGAGFANAIAGGGSLISFPALLLSGISPVTANATSTLALWPGTLASLWAYRLQILSKRKQALALALPSILGGFLGSILLLHTPEKAFRVIVPYLILLACALLIAQDPIARWVAQRVPTGSQKPPLALWISQFLISIYGGYFGAGIGILMLAAMGIFLSEDMQSTNALRISFGLLINGAASLYFILMGVANLPAAGLMAVASITGGYVGARLAQKLSSKLFRIVVVSFGIIVALRLF